MKRIAALLLALFLLLSLVSCGAGEKPVDTAEGEAAAPLETVNGTEEKETDEPETEKVDKGPYVEATASLGVIGDILIHETNYKAALREDGSYDFTENYVHIKPYLEKYDFTVANLEVTLGGENPVVGKYPSAYPSFNCPDSVVDALKGAGVDMVLTANNHSYDTRGAGMARTIEVVKEKGLEYLGTRETREEDFYKVKEINGIKIGMACFTYSTENSSGIKSLNGIPMNAETSPLVSSFTYDSLDKFYVEAEAALSYMEENGAAFSVFYMHWGNEYQYVPNSYQTRIAKRLCEMGVDVIVGGHPHVIQPFETITAENGNETYCIYSTGNAISNQRKELMDSDNYSGHTEDGMIFGVTFEKWSDGTYRIAEVNIQPTWVIREKREGRFVYQIIPLDLKVSDWSVFDLKPDAVQQAKASYNRTLKLVGEGLNAAREKLLLEKLPTAVS